MRKSDFERETAAWEKVCHVCGKHFISAPFHAWRDGMRWFCSYHCTLRYDELKKEEKRTVEETKSIHIKRIKRYRREKDGRT